MEKSTKPPCLGCTVARPKNLVPSYLRHRRTGQARAVWTDPCGVRHDRLLPGKFGSKASKAAFSRLMLEVEASPHHVGAGSESLTLNELLVAYVEHAEHHYRHQDGRFTSEIFEVRIVVKLMREVYGEKPIKEFGPLSVKAVRQAWVRNGISRGECNRRVGLIKRILKWGVSEELVPAAVHQAVATVTGLQRGRTEAHDCDPVRPVDDAVVDATLPFLNRHVRGLVEFQRLTGCRPGEACSLRRSEIDVGGEVWLYRPTHHKGSWRGKDRVIAIGPRCQELLKGFFTPNLEDHVFSPRRAVEELRAERAVERVTPRYPSHIARNEAVRNRPGERSRMPNDQYDRTSYARAVTRACERAFAEDGELDQQESETVEAWRARLSVWRKEHAWAPNQLRHQHGTKVRKAFSLEHAGAALGHAKMSATEIYAERDAGLALEVAKKLG